MKYPTRCQIIDVTNKEVFPGVMGRTPDESKPHVGKFGMAKKLADGNVQITLDDGFMLFGFECWWRPIIDAPPAPLPDDEDGTGENFAE